MMYLPARSYYFLDEVAQNWGVKVTDLLDFAVAGHLQLSTLVGPTDVEAPDGSVCTVHGLQALVPTDIIPIVTRSVTSIRRFGTSQDHWSQFCDHQRSLKLDLGMLMLAAGDRTAFEKQAGRQADQQAATFAISKHFTEVTLHGKLYVFGAAQASIVRQLYEAAKAGRPWVRGTTMTGVAGTRSQKVAALFSHQIDPPWRDLIDSDGRGLYRLKVPAEVELASHVAYRKIARLFRRG
jgi:hypothetical protein